MAVIGEGVIMANNLAKTIVGVIFVLICCLIYSRFAKYPYRYIGYFYPNIDNMEYWDESGPVTSVEECKEWVDKMVVKYNATNYDYECGKDCYKGDPYDQNNQYTCRTSVE
jgi:hypothetical protein